MPYTIVLRSCNIELQARMEWYGIKDQCLEWLVNRASAPCGLAIINRGSAERGPPFGSRLSSMPFNRLPQPLPLPQLPLRSRTRLVLVVTKQFA